MDLYVIVGNPRTRKASVVRSLTGCFNRSVRDIQMLSGQQPLRLYARVGALQDTHAGPDDLLAEVARARCDAVLCALAPAAHPQRPADYPDAPAYLSAFAAAGWRLRAVAVLGQNGGGVRGAKVRQFALASTQPINATAQAVRAHFGWV
jgi:hypothetical protein